VRVYRDFEVGAFEDLRREIGGLSVHSFTRRVDVCHWRGGVKSGHVPRILFHEGGLTDLREKSEGCA
jgi:hypothetical protein